MLDVVQPMNYKLNNLIYRCEEYLKLALIIALVAVLVALFIAIRHADTLIVNSTPSKALDVEGINGLVPKMNTLLVNTDQKLNGTGMKKPQDFAVLPALTQGIRDIRQTTADANNEQKDYYSDLKARTDKFGDQLQNQLLGLPVCDGPICKEGSAGTIWRLNHTITTLDSTLNAAGTAITNIGALVTTLNQMGMDIDAHLLKDPEIKEALTQVAGLLKELKLTTEDVRLIMDKVQRDYTAPRTKKGWALVVLRSIVELAAKGAEFKIFIGK